ncbi:MAG: glycosyltransferase family 4 protein [Desulfobacterales bacterium]|nr:glycosyltransferase family 4 protein [Desulfobacterales bacterium]
MALWLVISFILGLGGSFLAAKRGFDWGLVDTPKARSSHLIPVPKGGGIGILIVFVLGAFWWQIPWTLWIPALIVSLVSLLGDYRDLSFKIRLAVQVVSATIVSSSIFLGFSVSEVSIWVSVLLFVFGVFFITATANYFNFMDGINGIAGLTGLIAFLYLGLFGLLEGKDIVWILMAFCIAAACLGFLPLNFPKPKVFMGDVGSVLLGFLFASWVLWFSQTLLEFVALVSFLFPFYADELSTLIVRIKDGDRLTKAHRRHIYQILVNQAGLSHVIVTLFYGFIQIVVAILAWLVMREGLILLVSLLIILSGIFFLGGIYIRRRWEEKELYSGY